MESTNYIYISVGLFFPPNSNSNSARDSHYLKTCDFTSHASERLKRCDRYLIWRQRTQDASHFISSPRVSRWPKKWAQGGGRKRHKMSSTLYERIQVKFPRSVVWDALSFEMLASLRTRDHWDDIVSTDGGNTNTNEPAANNNRGKASWNKPNTLKQIVIRSVELCPTVSAKDEGGLPASYQPIDALLDVVWKRISYGKRGWSWGFTDWHLFLLVV
jgi:hypothetical protein